MQFKPFQPPPTEHHQFGAGHATETGVTPKDFVDGVNKYLSHLFEAVRGRDNDAVDSEARVKINLLEDAVSDLQFRLDALTKPPIAPEQPPKDDKPAPVPEKAAEQGGMAQLAQVEKQLAEKVDADDGGRKELGEKIAQTDASPAVLAAEAKQSDFVTADPVEVNPSNADPMEKAPPETPPSMETLERAADTKANTVRTKP